MLNMRYAVLIVSLVFYAAIALPKGPPGTSAERTSLKVKALDINLGGSDCKNVPKVWVVMDGDENAVFPASSKQNLPMSLDGAQPIVRYGVFAL